MGYRNYIGKLPKEKWEKIKDLNEKELKTFINSGDDEEYLGKRDIGVVELYELGKYCDYDYKEFLGEFFTDKDTNYLFHNEDTEFYLVKDKQFLANIIHDYNQKVMEYYEKMLKNYDRQNISNLTQSEIFEGFEHLRSMYFEWMHNFVYDLEVPDKITSSWKYEYAIFELIRIYKSFDWENDVMIYYGG